MIPYGGPIRPPVYRVDPPSPRERQRDRRFLALVVLFIFAAVLLLEANFLASGIAFALWYTVKRLWKIQ